MVDLWRVTAAELRGDINLISERVKNVESQFEAFSKSHDAIWRFAEEARRQLSNTSAEIKRMHLSVLQLQNTINGMTEPVAQFKSLRSRAIAAIAALGVCATIVFGLLDKLSWLKSFFTAIWRAIPG